jgi:hypothetical protein
MKKLFNGIFQSPATTLCGGSAGIIQIKQGLETHNYWLVASGALTVLLGFLCRDAQKNTDV